MSNLPVAKRVTSSEARRAFDRGARILVSEHGHKAEHVVYPSTVTHTRETTTWDELREQVNMWRNRYPNQRYYVVGE